MLHVSGKRELTRLGFWRNRFRKGSRMRQRSYPRRFTRVYTQNRCLSCGKLFGIDEQVCPSCLIGYSRKRGVHKDPETSSIWRWRSQIL